MSEVHRHSATGHNGPEMCIRDSVNTASYTILVAGREKNTGEEWDVLEFSSLTELKKYRKSHPEKMAFRYSYALSRGVATQFRHINIAEADHFKPVSYTHLDVYKRQLLLLLLLLLLLFFFFLLL